MKRLFVLLLMSSAFFGITPTVEAEEALDVWAHDREHASGAHLLRRDARLDGRTHVAL